MMTTEEMEHYHDWKHMVREAVTEARESSWNATQSAILRAEKQIAHWRTKECLETWPYLETVAKAIEWKISKIRRWCTIQNEREDRINHVFDADYGDGPCSCPRRFAWLDFDKYPQTATLIKQIEKRPILGREKSGLLLWGESGAGKTISAWHEIRRWLNASWVSPRKWDMELPAYQRRKPDWMDFIDEDGEWIHPAPAYAFTIEQLKSIATGAALRRPDDLKKWQQLLDGDGLVFIDDLDKAVLTKSFSEKLFALIDNIYSRDRLFIVTLNSPGKKLIEGWCSDEPRLETTAKAILRRLKDHCTDVRVGGTKKGRK